MNFDLFQLINQFAGKYLWLDFLMVNLANYAQLIFPAILIYFWFYSTENVKREQCQRTSLYAAICAGTSLIVNLVVNMVYFNPRPFVTHSVHQLIPHSAAESSFASDHAILAYSVAFILLFLKHKIRYKILFLAVLVSISRVFVGVHYPGDIAGSIVISLVSSFMIIKFSKYLEPFVQLIFNRYATLTVKIPLLSKYSHKQYLK